MPETPQFNPEEYAQEKGDFTDVHNPELQQELRDAGESSAERNRAIYQRLVERGKNREMHETIDIYETPLLLRHEEGLLLYLEYDRVGAMRAKGITQQKFRNVEPSLRDSVFYLELPVPYDQKEWNFDPKNFTYEFSDIDESAVRSLVEKSTKLAHEANYRDSDTISFNQQQERQAFIAELLNNTEYRKIWLASQQIALGKKETHQYSYQLGLPSQFIGKGNRFLVNPEPVDQFTINADQSHHDFIFEVLAIKDIPISQIAGYVEYDHEAGNNLLSQELSKTAKNIYGYGKNTSNKNDADRAGIHFARYYLQKLVDEVQTGCFVVDGRPKHKLADEDIEKKILELCSVLDLKKEDFVSERARKLIETTAGVYSRMWRRNDETRIHKVSDFPDIDTENLTFQQIDDQIYERMLPRLQQLFPYQEFHQETIEEDVEAGLRRYILDRFGVKPEDIKVKDFIHLIIKNMGIPIYNKQGDQIWPKKMSYEEVKQFLAEKDSRQEPISE